jgi:hypothetical protein
VNHTSSAARTTAVCLAAGSATMTMTVGTTLMRRAAVRSHPAQHMPFLRPTHLPPQHPFPSCHHAGLAGGHHPGQGIRSPSHLTPPHPTPRHVLEFVPFHLISCFSPFSHCPPGVAEVGVSDVPCSCHIPASAPEPTHPRAVPLPIVLHWPFPRPGACLSSLVPPIPSPHTVCPGAGPETCALSHASVPSRVSVSTRFTWLIP